MSDNPQKQAYLYSSCPPNESQKVGFEQFITKKYGEEYEIVWEKSEDYAGGFALRIGFDFYDFSVKERLHQLRNTLTVLHPEEDVIPILKQKVKNWKPSTDAHEVGTVLSVGDGVAFISGLENAFYGEILLFENDVKGMVLSLKEEVVGSILFDSDDSVSEGSMVYRTGKMAGLPVGKNFVGRVVNALGEPIDGKGEIDEDGYRAVENTAPKIIDRQPVSKPMETGLLVIDSMFPIGRGQRELIIGDRQTGKTAIAIDTILNQKGKNVLCIYVAIGQKTSSIVQINETLKKYGAMDYTIIVGATASESAPLQYIAPYAGCALAEYFMMRGKDVLIVYDDLTKHATAYRSISLLLNRSPGREAYPGDIFYLHSRLLERSAHLTDNLGGGSITALPIVETQAGDVSAYIPTNIISITDGQIFLESNLFFSGQRPAVNVGISVSRVGGDAQTKAMKKVAGTLRLDLAQYREMEVFTRFSNDLDEITKRQLAYGQNLMQILKQDKCHPLKMYSQVILLDLLTHHVFKDIDVAQFKKVAFDTIEYIERYLNQVCYRVETTGEYAPEDQKIVMAKAQEYLKQITAK